MQNVPFATQQEQVNKFLQANRVLGAQMDQMQGTTRIIYDTFGGTTNFQTTTNYNFFSEVAAKVSTTYANQPATNITDNRFEPGEGMVIKEIGFYNMSNSASPASPARVYNSVLGLSLINLYIGNNRVIKDMPLFMAGSYSPLNNISPITSSAENQIINRVGAFRLFTNIVIPPQIQFYLNMQIPFLGTSEAENEMNIFRVYLKGYGKLFNPRNNY
jgi:hypothetical protein